MTRPIIATFRGASSLKVQKNSKPVAADIVNICQILSFIVPAGANCRSPGADGAAQPFTAPEVSPAT
jgi:hypothetical protein